MVIGLNNSITCYQYTFAIADESADGCPLGNPASLTAHLVIREPFLTVNSATSALAKVRHFTLETSASSIILVNMAGGNHLLLITVPISKLSAILI